MGVTEHTFDVDIPNKPTVTWHIFDVGGARGQRHTWVPYFDDAKGRFLFSNYLAVDVETNRPLRQLSSFSRPSVPSIR
jgi:guanine nucleotide-binding protein alpha-1 subunit